MKLLQVELGSHGHFLRLKKTKSTVDQVNGDILSCVNDIEGKIDGNKQQW